MIKIRLEHIRPPANGHYIEANKYCVTFGWENHYRFKHITQAKLFLNKLNNFINDNVCKLNMIYSQLFQEYRQAWFYYDYQQNNAHLLLEIENKFNKLFRKINPANYPHFLHHDLLLLIDLLKQFAESINKVNKNKKIYNSYNHVNMLINMLDEVQKKIEKPDF